MSAPPDAAQPATIAGPVAAGTSRRRTAARVLLSAAAIGIAAAAVLSKREELSGVGTYLDNVRPIWVLAAVAAEAAAIVCLAVLQQRLLRAGRLVIGLPALTAITLASNAIGTSFPGGQAWAVVWAYRQFRRRGAGEVLAGWTTIAANVLTILALVAVAGAGLLLADSQGSSLGLGSVIAGLVVLALIVVVLSRQGAWLITWATGCVRLSQRLFRAPAGNPDRLVEHLAGRLTAVSPAREDWVVVVVLALANWSWDCLCLVAAFLAVGAEVPWRGLVLAYGAAQLAASLPITPGGLGVVEGSLTVALVAYGGAEVSTVAAVLLYRIIAFWALLPIGWGAWSVITVRARKPRPGPATEARA